MQFVTYFGPFHALNQTKWLKWYKRTNRTINWRYVTSFSAIWPNLKSLKLSYPRITLAAAKKVTSRRSFGKILSDYGALPPVLAPKEFPKQFDKVAKVILLSSFCRITLATWLIWPYLDSWWSDLNIFFIHRYLRVLAIMPNGSIFISSHNKWPAVFLDWKIGFSC